MDYETGKLLERIEAKIDLLITYFQQKEEQQEEQTKEQPEEVKVIKRV